MKVPVLYTKRAMLALALVALLVLPASLVSPPFHASLQPHLTQVFLFYREMITKLQSSTKPLP